MFQTNQGPSFPAHQFLLSGTSAPNEDTPYYNYFASENPSNGNDQAGCIAVSGTTEELISPTGVESTPAPVSYPCYDHPTLTDLLDNHLDVHGNPAPIPWRYYSGLAAGIWTAPTAISHICGASSGSCQGTDWTNNVGPYLEATNHLGPFMSDLSTCNFGSGWTGGVIFVVPDARWSDHAGGNANIGLGPDWVANIVNLVGRTSAQHACTGSQPNWTNTAVVITWDDWGGWYDHVNPIAVAGHGLQGYYQGSGNGQQYVYGFRVPLLVVSAYAKQDTALGRINHISNINYDFGSILAFVEDTYGLSNDIDPFYHYADYFAAQQTSSDLSDFFDYTQQRTFNMINRYYDPNECNTTTCSSSACDVACFIGYKGSAEDPDSE
jgi:hypothetical protein